MEVVVRERSRHNGWSWPAHYLQVIAWLLILYLSILQFALIAPAFNSMVTKIVLFATMTFLIGFLILLKITLTTIDPSDFAVQMKLKERTQPKFDRNKHRHVIEDDYYCNICEEIVHPSSKHCRQCNKCVLDFDHHCKWLNNCVGARNYKWFLIFIGITVLTTGSIALQAFVAFLLYFLSPETLDRTTDSSSLGMFGSGIPDGVWLGFLISTFVISSLISGLTLHLFIFHIRLVKRGVTTYNFIMDQKRQVTDLERNKSASSTRSQNGNQHLQNFPSAPPPPSNGWINGLKTKITHSRQNSRDSIRAENTNSAKTKKSKSIRVESMATGEPSSSTSTVPKLPPILKLQAGQQQPEHHFKKNPSILKSVTKSNNLVSKSFGGNVNHHVGNPTVTELDEISNVPYAEIHNHSSSSTSPTESLATSLATDTEDTALHDILHHHGVGDNAISSISSRVPFGIHSSSNNSHQKTTVSMGVTASEQGSEKPGLGAGVVKLPPLSGISPKQSRPTTSKKVYEPHFETILLSERELTLPSIMVTQSDSDTAYGESLTEIPLKALKRTGSVTSVTSNPSTANLPPGSTVYITSGQITVTKITTPPESTDWSHKNITEISSNSQRRQPLKFQEESRFVDKGVACGFQSSLEGNRKSTHLYYDSVGSLNSNHDPYPQMDYGTSTEAGTSNSSLSDSMTSFSGISVSHMEPSNSAPSLRQRDQSDGSFTQLTDDEGNSDQITLSECKILGKNSTVKCRKKVRFEDGSMGIEP